MSRSVIIGLAALLIVLCSMPKGALAVTGADSAPGQTCSPEDAVTVTANPGGSGGYVLTCKSGTWKANIAGQTPTASDHLATKEYVDSAGAAGGEIKFEAATCYQIPFMNPVNPFNSQPCAPGFADVGNHSTSGRTCCKGAGGGSGATFEVDGFFVITNGQWWPSAIGGLSGANAKCLSDLQTRNWLGKTTVPSLSSSNVKAWLCDSSSCQNPSPGKTYAFASAIDPDAGGSTFKADAYGRGPGDTTAWSGADKFSVTALFASGRTAGSNHSWWPTSPYAQTCSNWSSSSGNFYPGYTVNANLYRWQDQVNYGWIGCGDYQLRLLCLVEK